MSRNYIKNKKNKIILGNKIKFPETIHERALELLNANMIEGFLPIAVKRKKQKAWLSCQVEGMVQASKYFADATGKLTFLDFVAQVIERISTCKNNFINPNNIFLNLDAIFVVPATGTVKCIYWPVVNNEKYVLPKDFFKRLPLRVNFRNTHNLPFLNKYNLFFSGVEAFSLLHFEKLILELAGKEVHTQSFSPESKLLQTNLPQLKVVEKENSINKTYDIFSQLDDKPISNQSLLASSENGGTVVLNESGSLINNSQASLVDVSGNVFSVASFPYWIGKNQEMNNLQLLDGAVSRRHAQIIYEQGKYYLIDSNSTNHTYLNGHKLNPEECYELKDGDEIRFARSKFTFVN